MKLAIFDFDGTLYKNETFPLLMKHLKEHTTYGPRYKGLYRSVLVPYISYKLKMYPERKMKMQMMQKYLRAFSGLTETELDEYFAEIANKMRDDFNQDVFSRLHKHNKDNFHTMIVSGAFTPLLKSVAKDVPVDTIIGTDVPLMEGFYDPKMPIDHVQAERKTELVHDKMNNESIDWENSFAYGDSYSDLFVLKLVGNPVAVSPDEKLREVAIQNKWEIIE
ncbi:HAD family hydrolase [Pseudogracilibacillus auburnensis]|uniref:HAD family hydrolase n=1 Tax=Pseudogracilibacillus auburnensis TaxID=1494959 RepID=UPI001A978872|nr:HAD-IB family hydrolase [Pseudogracilibacillus auburnensis]MBO1002834.1 HAD-IB family hydrolase [Pseudogracilibacillus auburnensis]